MKATTKSQMLVRLAFATFIFITPVVLTGCEKEDPIKPTLPPVVTVKLSTSIKALPIAFNSSKVSTVPYFGNLDITITTNIASTVTASVPADSVSVSGNSTTFTYRKLTADKFIEFTAVAGSNDRVVETATIKVIQPTAEEKMLSGTYDKVKVSLEDFLPPAYTELGWMELKTFLPETITFAADKSYIKKGPDYYFDHDKWDIVYIGGVRCIKRGNDIAVLEELTPTQITIRVDVTPEQFAAAHRRSRTVLVRRM